MIPEVREKMERTSSNGGVYDVEQKLQSYLRDKYSVDSLQNTTSHEPTVRLLAQVAKDWCMKHNDYRTEDEYYKLAEKAIKTYLNNWNGKQQGVDNRSHNLGRFLF